MVKLQMAENVPFLLLARVSLVSLFCNLVSATTLVAQDVPPLAEPKVPRIGEKEPLRYSVPRSKEEKEKEGFPSTVMEVPSNDLTTPFNRSQEPSGIILNDLNGRVIEIVRFGFVLPDRKPLKDAELKAKARKVISELWFGRRPDNCTIDPSGNLRIEGKSLRVVFVKVLKGQQIDLEEKREEPAVESQFAEQVRTILYAPSHRNLSRFEERKIFFGILKNGKLISDPSAELELQLQVYKLLRGFDVPNLEIDPNGFLLSGKDSISIRFFGIVPSSEGNTGKVEEIEEPLRTQLAGFVQQQSRQSLVVVRKAEKDRASALLAAREQMKGIETIAKQGRLKDQTKEGRIGELKAQLPKLAKLTSEIQGLMQAAPEPPAPEEFAALLASKSGFEQTMENEIDSLTYPLDLNVGEGCGYRFVQKKRTEWSLSRSEKSEEGIANWSAAPLWYRCQGDTIVLSLSEDLNSSREAHWEVFHLGKLVLNERTDPEVLVKDARFINAGAGGGNGRSLVQLLVEGNEKRVIEFDPAAPVLRNRILTDLALDPTYRFWLQPDGQIEVAQIKEKGELALGRFRSLSIATLSGKGDTFLFQAASEKEQLPMGSKGVYIVKGDTLSEITEKIPQRSIGAVRWDDSRGVYRLQFESDQINFLEVDPASLEVVTRLQLPAECEGSYLFTVEKQGTVAVQRPTSGADVLLRVEKIRSISCSKETLFLLAHKVEVVDRTLKSVEDPGRGIGINVVGDSSLFVLIPDKRILGISPLKGFNFASLRQSAKADGVEATLSGPVSLTIEVGSDGNWLAPSVYGSPFSGTGAWVDPRGPAILLNRGDWLFATEKLTSLEGSGEAVSLVGTNVVANPSSTKVSDGSAELSPSRNPELASVNGANLLGRFRSPLESEGEEIQASRLVNRRGWMGHRVWLKGNEDYTLLVGMDGEVVDAVKYTPPPPSAIVWPGSEAGK